MGSWSAANVIVFGGRGNGPLRRVSSSGGTPTEVTALANGDTFHTYPVLLPDGQHFVYLRSGNNETRGIYAGSLDRKPGEQPNERLLANPFGAVYVPAADSGIGRLLFLRESTLMAQPFDPVRLELTSEPVPIAEQVGSAGSGGYFAASVGALAYRGGGGSARRLSWYDRKGMLTGVAAGEASFNEIELSPDGARVVSFQDAAQGDLWLFDFTRAANTRFTFEPGLERYPVWSPDGNYIAYTSTGGSNLYRKSSNGAGDAELLLKSSEGKATQDWSRDGRYLLYDTNDSKTNADLWVMPLEGDRKAAPVLVTPFVEFQARFSPDGRWIVYVSNESGTFSVYVRPFVPPGSSALPNSGGKWMISNGSGYQPRWRRDGKEILYLSPTGKMMSVDVSVAGGSFQAGVPKPLFDVPGIYGSAAVQTLTARWDVTADGQKFLVNTTANAGGPTPITVLTNWQTALKK
jgi:Tol biopolymer transport system component